MGLELARAFVRIRADASGLRGDLDEVEQETTGRLAKIAGMVTATLGAFSMPAKNFLEGGVELAKEFEQTTIKMETMLGTAEAAKKTLADLTQFAIQTPFEMPGILSIATQMIMFGERGEQLMETMKLLADASGGTPAQFQILGLVLNQIRGVGKLLTQDFRQLSSRGIVSLQDLANYFKVTTSAAQEMISNGKIGFEDFRKVLLSLTQEGGRFYKMAEKQSKSLEGLTSTLKDSWNIMKRILASSLVPFLKSTTSWLIQMVDAAQAMVQKYPMLISGTLSMAVAVASLGTVIAGLITAYKLLGMTMFDVILGSGIGVAIIAIGAAFGALVVWVQKSEQAQKMLNDAWERMKQLAAPVIMGFNAALYQSAPILKEIISLADELLRNVLDGFKALAEAIFGVSDYLGDSYKGWRDMFNAIITGIRDVLDWLTVMSSNWEVLWVLIKNEATKAFLFVTQEVAVGVTHIIGAFQKLLVFVGGVWKKLSIELDGFIQKLIFIGTLAALPGGLALMGKDAIDARLKEIDKDTAFEKAAVDRGIKNDDLYGKIDKGTADAVKSIREKGKPTFDLLDDVSRMAKNKLLEARVKRREGMPSEGEGSVSGGVGAGVGTGGEAEGSKKKSMVAVSGDIRAMSEFRGAAKGVLAKEEAVAKAADAVSSSAQALASMAGGRYSFQEFGTKIQDVLLGKDKKDLDSKRNDLLAMSLTKQDALIKGVHDLKGIGGLTAGAA